MRSMLFRRLVTTGAALLGLVLFADGVGAQSLGDRLKKKAADAAKKAAETPPAKPEPAKPAPATTPAASTPAATPAPAATAPAADSAAGPEKPFVNFDFVPGSRVLFADDFAKDNVGDFPRRLEFKKGNMEVAEWKGRRWLHVVQNGEFVVRLPEVLPERFTIELDYVGMNKYELEMRFVEMADKHSKVLIGGWGAGVNGGGITAMTAPPKESQTGAVKVRVMVDGRYAKVYLDGTRVANVPNADLGRDKAIWFKVPAYNQEGSFVADLRIAAGGKDLYDALAAEGRVATQGIFFDTGSDRIRGESAPTLKQIAAMLTEHTDLKLLIEGHTDNTGDAAANLRLSERRAAAVKAALVAQHAIAAERLTTAGFGVTRPAAPNATPEGRQQNRRVELVKQ